MPHRDDYFRGASWEDDIDTYLHGGDQPRYMLSELSSHLFGELCEEINRRLPDGVSWQPARDSFYTSPGVNLPSEEELRWVFDEAWDSVSGRLEQIERQLFGALPVSVQALEKALAEIESPLHRAVVAGELQQMARRVQAEALSMAAQGPRDHGDIAELLGIDVSELRAAIEEHRSRVG
jgi:hypothetical protein